MPEPNLQLENAYRVAIRRYFQRDYVTGVTVGEKIKGGSYLPEVVIRVHVREKLPEKVLRKHQVFPLTIEGIPLDVVERTYSARDSMDIEERRVRRAFPVKPLQPGVSIGKVGGEEGTLGLIVWDLFTGSPGILTAAHVLLSNYCDASVSPTGSQIVQPAENRGWPSATTAVSDKFRWTWDWRGDAAFAPLSAAREINLNPLGLDQYTPRPHVAAVNDVVVKSGQKTGVTCGKVESVGKLQVEYRNNKKLEIYGFEVRPFDAANLSDEEISEGGDSGSVWFHRDTMEPAGLLIAGDRPGTEGCDEHSLACDIGRVLDDLDVSLEPLETSPMTLITTEAATWVNLLE